MTGVVVEVGASGSGLKASDRVHGYASVFAGGSRSFAEFVAANSSTVADAPQKGSFVEAVTLPLVGASALQAIEQDLTLHRGQRILIHGGAGGLGSVAIQLAKFIGAYV